MKHQLRQGDVLLEPIATPPLNLTAVPRRNGRLILALGEATGHHHAIADPKCELYTDELNRRFLHVMASVTIEHEEHTPITIAPGWYEQIAPNEYAGDQMAPLPSPD